MSLIVFDVVFVIHAYMSVQERSLIARSQKNDSPQPFDAHCCHVGKASSARPG